MALLQRFPTTLSIKKIHFTCKALTVFTLISLLSGCDLVKELLINLDAACNPSFILVNTTGQANPTSFVFCNPGSTCSIQDAIATALAVPLEVCENNTMSEIIVVLRPGVTYTIGRPVEYGDEENPEGGPTAFAHITKKIKIQCDPSRESAIIKRAEGAPAFRFFYIASEGELTLENVILENGQLERPSDPFDEVEFDNGGAIFNKGKLTLKDCTVRGTLSRQAIYNAAEGETYIYTSTIANNQENGIESVGDIVIEQSSIESNEGTGIVLGQSSVSQATIKHCFIFGNKNSGIRNRFAERLAHEVDSDGGVNLEGRARVIIENTTIAQNEAQMGGGIWNRGLVEMNHVSFVYNKSRSGGDPEGGSAGGGGAIYNHESGGTDRAAHVMASNSLLAFNQAGEGMTGRANCGIENDLLISFTFRGTNFISDNSCGESSSSILIGEPLIGPLSGEGFGQGYPPLPGSPLLNAATDCPSGDQRGNPRIGSGCDIGAIEVE